MTDNATFYSFKPSGKYYSTGRGAIEAQNYEPISNEERRLDIVKQNGGKMPGLNSIGSSLMVIVVPDESVEFGWPLFLSAIS